MTWLCGHEGLRGRGSLRTFNARILRFFHNKRIMLVIVMAKLKLALGHDNYGS